MRDIRTLITVSPYSLTSILARVFLMLILTLLSLWFIVLLITLFEGHHETITMADLLPRTLGEIRGVLILFFTYTILVESILLVNVILEKLMPGLTNLRLKKGIEIVLIIVIAFVALKLGVRFGPDKNTTPGYAYYSGFLIGLIFATFGASTLVLWLTTNKWIKALHDIEIIKKEKLETDYNSLQEQLNPHFLFNNLSVLKSLIYHDKKMALAFTEDFSEVYRYVLQSGERNVVTLEEEIGFINMFLNLHKARLGEGLMVKMAINPAQLHQNIASLSLQLLVENAIKHNITSKDNPLLLEISTTDNFIIVRNKIQRKETQYSTKKGLNNLKRRYALLSEIPVKMTDDNNYFTVKVPLL